MSWIARPAPQSTAEQPAHFSPSSREKCEKNRPAASPQGPAQQLTIQYFAVREHDVGANHEKREHPPPVPQYSQKPKSE